MFETSWKRDSRSFEYEDFAERLAQHYLQLRFESRDHTTCGSIRILGAESKERVHGLSIQECMRRNA